MSNLLKTVLLKLLQDDINPIKNDLKNKGEMVDDLKDQIQRIRLELSQKDFFIENLERKLKESQDFLILKENKINEYEMIINSLNRDVLKLEQEDKIEEVLETINMIDQGRTANEVPKSKSPRKRK